MRHTIFSALLLAGLTAAPAAQAQDLGQIISGVAQGLLNQELDRTAWDQARQTNTAAAYRSYLSRFPNGAYAASARQQLTRLGATPAAPAAPAAQGNQNYTPPVVTTAASSAARTEAGLNLKRADRLRIQRQLTAIGYDTRGVDGLWGARTRDAIQRWQRDQGQSVTGYVTAAQVQAIARQAGGNSGTAGTTQPQESDAQVEERLVGLTAAERREVQLRLTLLGYDTRGTDGVFGQNTRTAISRWQGDNAMRATGYLTADQVKVLRTSTRG